MTTKQNTTKTPRPGGALERMLKWNARRKLKLTAAAKSAIKLAGDRGTRDGLGLRKLTAAPDFQTTHARRPRPESEIDVGVSGKPRVQLTEADLQPGFERMTYSNLITMGISPAIALTKISELRHQRSNTSAAKGVSR